MTEHHDALETRSPDAREADLFARLPAVLAAAMQAPAYARHLGAIDPAAITDRNALSTLPVLRKAELPALQKEAWPFGGFVPAAPGGFGRLFTSPGPIFEPEGTGIDPWGAARGLFAAGFRPGDIVLNTFGYHLTPGGFIMDSGARALGCAVIPAGPGNTEQQMEVIAAYRPTAYAGTPDFLKILVEAAESRASTSPASSARSCRVLPSRPRCRPGCASAASTPTSSTPPPMSASSPMRPRPARAWC